MANPINEEVYKYQRDIMLAMLRALIATHPDKAALRTSFDMNWGSYKRLHLVEEVEEKQLEAAIWLLDQLRESLP